MSNEQKRFNSEQWHLESNFPEMVQIYDCRSRCGNELQSSVSLGNNFDNDGHAIGLNGCRRVKTISS